MLGALVRHHLLLIDTATRRDLDDPATVRSVADAVGSVGTLEILHALTEADALATGPAAWSAWRGSLVADLVARVAAVLRGTAPAVREAEIPTTEQERLAVEALRTGEPVLALHVRQEEEDAVGGELVVAVPDQPGVLPAVAGVLALHRLTVRAADLRSMELPDQLGEVLVLRWRVAAEYGALPQAARLRSDLVRALDGSLDVPAKLADREAAYPQPARGDPAAAPGHGRPGRLLTGHGPGGAGARCRRPAAPDRAGSGVGGRQGAERARLDAGRQRRGHAVRHVPGRQATGTRGGGHPGRVGAGGAVLARGAAPLRRRGRIFRPLRRSGSGVRGGARSSSRAEPALRAAPGRRAPAESGPVGR